MGSLGSKFQFYHNVIFLKSTRHPILFAFKHLHVYQQFFLLKPSCTPGDCKCNCLLPFHFIIIQHNNKITKQKCKQHANEIFIGLGISSYTYVHNQPPKKKKNIIIITIIRATIYNFLLVKYIKLIFYFVLVCSAIG